MRRISSWGRLSAPLHKVVPLMDRDRVGSVLAMHRPGISFGMGRSYGDVCLNPNGVLWSTRGLDRFIQFDELTGRLVCETGVLLRDIQQLTLPYGWMLPVTPGTQLVTVGGAIANDVHGKNHHGYGSFGDHVLSLKLNRTDGELIECGPRLQADWFAATVGGLGLTGVILEAEIQLRRVPGPWLDTEKIPYASLDEFFQLADDSEALWEHTVSWVDCLSKGKSRGLFMRANFTDMDSARVPSTRALTFPWVPPISLVNRMTLRPFNTMYYHTNARRAGREIIHYESFFYPLDKLLEWNRMYGPKGFFQYQSVVPRGAGHEAIQAMLDVIATSGEGSFLAVLKTFGQRHSPGLLSFPQPGVTLALDFPNQGQKTLALFDRLDAIVREAGGRIYCAKNAYMSRDLFEAGYPRLNEFLTYRDPGISSGLSRRLMGS
jgi:FAD/FMN-containing dehydrogenase